MLTQILPCPECMHLMVLDQSVSAQATLRCPECQSVYVLNELVTSRLRHWEVVNDPSPKLSTSVDQGHHPGIVEVPDEDGQELQLEPVATDRIGSEPVSLDATATRSRSGSNANRSSKVDWAKFKPITHEEFERMRRKSSSGVWTIIQVVLGGVAAIPVSLLLIWHVVGTDIGDAGLTVGKYAPWLVPEKFRPHSDWQPEATQMGDEPDLLPDVIAGPDDQTADRKPPETIINPPSDDESRADGKPSSSANSTEPPEPESIFHAIGLCNTSLDAWQDDKQGSLAEKQRLARSLYSSFEVLASRLGEVPGDDPTLRVVFQQCQSLAQRVEGDMELGKIIEAGARAKFKKATWKNNGVALIAKISKAAASDGNLQLEIDTSSTGIDNLNTIHVARPLSSDFENSQVFVLGIRERAPNEKAIQAAYISKFVK